MLELHSIHTYYGDSHILRGISLEVKEGSVVALLGRNGMGKTTLIRSIVGFTPPRRGTIRFKGREIQSRPSYEICRNGLGLVPQGRRMFPSLTVEENLMIGARGKRWTLDKIYSLFPRLKERAKFKGNMLSGGEQQIASIARALLTNPDFVLMDEPSEGLAPLIVKELAGALTDLKREGLSFLLVEQNVPLALRVSDYAYILSQGEIVYHSTSAELARNAAVQSEHLGVADRRTQE